MQVKDWNIEEMTGYHPITTLYTDFGIAEKFGAYAIKDTYKRVRECFEDVETLTELVMVLNWKIWEHYEHNEKLAELYDGLWREMDSWCCENFNNKELEYFYSVTD